MLPRPLIAALVISAAACTAERPHADKPDAGTMSMMLEPPSLDPATPMGTPRDTVALRGSTSGARLVVKGGPGDPVEQAALPGGSFCLDAPLAPSGPTDLDVYALKDGQISQPTRITVTKDAAAAIPSQPICLGQEMPTCVAENSASMNCSNMKDDNCNGLTDACDTGCNGCMDDPFEPNNQPFFVPIVAAGTYQMSLCPCLVDWVAFSVAQGEVIHVKTTFSTTAIDLDMKLQTPAAAEQNSADYVAISQTVTGVEEITYTAAATGLYYLKIYPYETDKSGKYTLTIF